MTKFFFKTYLLILLPTVFILISLGGAVRSMHAGLACPDWPLCFGKVIPDYQLQVYYEFIHRTIAGFVGIATLILTVIILSNKNLEPKFKKNILIADLILIGQIVLGGLTVLKLLQFQIVTLHLVFGLAFFCSLLWLYFNFSENIEVGKTSTPVSINYVLGFVLALVVGQIFLGGMVSTNYAGLACDSFPLCNGELFPTFTGLIGIQVLHRGWGYVTAFGLMALFRVIYKSRNQEWMTKKYLNLSRNLVVLIILQICIGAINVLYKTPPTVTVLHLAVATLILSTILKMFYLGLSSGQLN